MKFPLVTIKKTPEAARTKQIPSRMVKGRFSVNDSQHAQISGTSVRTMAADDDVLKGVWFEGQKYFASGLDKKETEDKETPVLKQTKEWLDLYFAGKEPEFLPPLAPEGSEFQKKVWKILLMIPYGKTMTYGEIGRKVAEMSGKKTMSAQAVGGAVGHNPISILIPCHRVVGTNGSLTGYAGGIEKKIGLLKLERTDMSEMFVPKKGTAL